MRRRAPIVFLAAVVLSTVATFAVADTEHGRPTCTAPPLDETATGSRDGFDHFHESNPAVAASLVELEGFLNVCRTNDNPIIEGASASARTIRVSGVNRVQLRAQLQQWRDGDDAGTAPDQWVTVASSDSVNTGDNRTLTVTTEFKTVNQVTAPLTQGWTRVNIRALYRTSDRALTFVQRPTYPVWVDDGPTAALPA